MMLFKTKNDEVFNLDDLSRIVKSHFNKESDKWIYQVIPKVYVNAGNGTCPIYIDEEEYNILIQYFNNILISYDKLKCKTDVDLI